MKYLPRSARLAWRCVCGARLGEFIRVSCTTIAHRDTAGRTLAPSLWSALAARPHHLRLSSEVAQRSGCRNAGAISGRCIATVRHARGEPVNHWCWWRALARPSPTSMPTSTTTTVTTTVTVTTASGEVSWPDASVSQCAAARVPRRTSSLASYCAPRRSALLTPCLLPQTTTTTTTSTTTTPDASSTTVEEGVPSAADVFALDIMVRKVQRTWRGYRDMREAELGWVLRKKGSGGSTPLLSVLNLWGTGEERPAGNLTVEEKHTLLEEARASGGVSLKGEFGKSIISRVANLGKGIAETENPMLLAQHQWLESTDRRHRYGAYLFDYYAVWAAADTTDSFFYWLDSGGGKDVQTAGPPPPSPKNVPRAQLESAEVRYCNKSERLEFVVEIKEGKLYYANQGDKPVHLKKKSKPKKGAPEGSPNEPVMMIYVMSPDGTLYIGDKKKERFHHSSFLSGSAVIAAGSVCVEEGVLKELTPHSGHYRPSDDDFARCVQSFKDAGVPMEEVKIAAQKARKEKNLSALVAQGANAQSDPSVGGGAGSDEETPAS